MSMKIKKNISLELLSSLNIESQMSLRDIRNDNDIRKWMYTDHIISVKEHQTWIDKIKKDDKQKVYALLDINKEVLGMVSANSIDYLHKKADWAFYLSKTARGGLGAALEYYFINHVFYSLGLEKLNCEVIEGNDAVVKLHKGFLFKEEGFRRSNIIKNGIRIGVHLLGLTKKEWNEEHQSILEKYKDKFDNFTFSMKE